MLGVVDPRTVAQAPAATGGFSSRVQARVQESESVRSRIAIATGARLGGLWAFVDEDFASGRFSVSGFGLATPFFDLGPIRESGLIAELNHPVGIGSIREPTAVVLDRAFDVSSLRGGVVRILDSGLSPRIIQLYGVSRGGRAPEGTKSGGCSLTAWLGRTTAVDIASKITLFGAPPQSDEWFLDVPPTELPSILRAGVRVSSRYRGGIAVVTAGAAVSDQTRPAGFASGCLGWSGRILSHEGGPLAMYSARVDLGAVDPNYIGDDGRYPTRTLLVHPVFSFRLPGMRLTGWYRCELDRLPLLPAACRRIVHTTSVEGELLFGPLSAGAIVRPTLDYNEDGRVIYRLSCGPFSRLSGGNLSVETSIDLARSNVDGEEVGGRIAFEVQGRQGMASLSLDVHDRLGRLRAEVAAVKGRFRLAAGVVVPDLLSVDIISAEVSLNGSFAAALARSVCTLSLELDG